MEKTKHTAKHGDKRADGGDETAGEDSVPDGRAKYIYIFMARTRVRFPLCGGGSA